MKELSDVLKDNLETPSSKLSALDELSDLVESIDNAKNLFMVDGVAPLIQCIRGKPRPVMTDVIDDDDSLRRRAAEVLTTVVQNNPRAQQWAREGGATLKELINALVSVSEDFEKIILSLRGNPDDLHLVKVAEKIISTRASLVTAISALVRDNAASQRDLVSSDSGKALFTLLKPISDWPAFSLTSTLPDKIMLNGRRLIRKTIYALRHLCMGSQADAVMAAVLLNGNDEERSLNIAGHLLSASLSWPSPAAMTSDVSGVMRDIPDIRENALSVLISLASNTTSFGGVIEDARDERKPRSLFSGAPTSRDIDAPGSAVAAQPLLLQDSMVKPMPTMTAATNATNDGSPFIPSLEWQEIQQGQRIPAGLEIKLDLATGKQFARQMTAEERAGYRSDFSHNSTSARAGSGALSEVSSESADRARALRVQQKIEEEESTKEKNESVITAVRGARFAALLHSITIKFNDSGGVPAFIEKLKAQAALSRSLSDTSTSSLLSSSDELRFTDELANVLLNIYENRAKFASLENINNTTDVAMD